MQCTAGTSSPSTVLLQDRTRRTASGSTGVALATAQEPASR